MPPIARPDAGPTRGRRGAYAGATRAHAGQARADAPDRPRYRSQRCASLPRPSTAPPSPAQFLLERAPLDVESGVRQVAAIQAQDLAVQRPVGYGR